TAQDQTRAAGPARDRVGVNEPARGSEQARAAGRGQAREQTRIAGPPRDRAGTTEPATDRAQIARQVRHAVQALATDLSRRFTGVTTDEVPTASPPVRLRQAAADRVILSIAER